MTFSIVARCNQSGMLGMGIASAIPAVGALCCFGSTSGIVATQSWVNPYIGIDGVAQLIAGGDAQSVLSSTLARDPRPEMRQVGIVDSNGVAAAFTGAKCTGWAGHRSGVGYTVQGNMLVGEVTLEALESSFVESAGLPLDERLVLALEHGEAAGGDKRGRQSACLLVYDEEDYAYVDLRVDDSPDPIVELRRIWSLATRQLLPFVKTLPKRSNPGGEDVRAVIENLMRSPAQRSSG